MRYVMKVVYLKHPVSAEQKAECIARGEKILDIRFKPADVEAEKPKTVTRAKRTKKSS